MEVEDALAGHRRRAVGDVLEERGRRLGVAAEVEQRLAEAVEVVRRLARWFHAQSPLPMALAAAIDVVQIATRRQSTNLQVLARKR